MLLYQSKVFEKHNTGGHPESISRIVQINAMLESQGWMSKFVLPTWNAIPYPWILRNHDAAYIDRLQHWVARDSGRIEVDTVVSTGSWEACTFAAGAVCDAVERIYRGEEKMAFCAIRPPGHHAVPESAMGFCLLNNVAIAARHARSLGIDKVMIIDWDIHHGNGTQASFWEDPTVAFVSIHRFPFYPGTGKEDETGGGLGLGTKANIPVPSSTSARDFISKLQKETEKLASRFQPQLILLSAGFDAHKADPVGGLSLESEDFQTLGNWVRQVADTYCNGKIISVLEGGYHLTHLPESVDAHLRGLAME